MAKAKPELIDGIHPVLDPHELFRVRDCRKVWGIGPTRMKEKIDAGEIPPPTKFYPTGRASGWTGHVINEARRKNAEKKSELATGAK